MRNDDVQIRCFKCGNEYTMSMMRMHSDGKNLVCKSCLDRKPASQMKEPSTLPVSAKPTMKMESKPKPQVFDSTEYFCKDCRYSFKRASHLVIKVCPYCGSSGGVQEKGSTDRIIADAARMKG
jgi:DNA-directed RNA polymerase subunit RPC12/RpoP